VINNEAVAVDAPRANRVAILAAMLGVLVAVLFGVALVGAAPAHATTSTPSTPHPPTAQHVAGKAGTSSTVKHTVATHPGVTDRDVLVGGLAGAAMLGTAGAVLWYTARSRYLY
jgi:hypothetical protein